MTLRPVICCVRQVDSSLLKIIERKNLEISELRKLIQIKNTQTEHSKEENQSLRKKLATAKNEERKRFGINKYANDNNAIKFYTGLPSYESFMALYNFVKPKDRYQLNYHNCKKDNITKDATCSKRGRPRALSDADELFLTLSGD